MGLLVVGEKIVPLGFVFGFIVKDYGYLYLGLG